MIEGAPDEIESMWFVACLELEGLRDETTILNFRHFLDQHGLGESLFKEVDKHPERAA